MSKSATATTLSNTGMYMIRTGSFALLMKREAEMLKRGLEEGLRYDDFFASENPQQSSHFSFEMDGEEDGEGEGGGEEKEPTSTDSSSSSSPSHASSSSSSSRSLYLKSLSLRQSLCSIIGGGGRKSSKE